MAIPAKLRPSWTFLHTQVIWLHGRWELFNQLYGKSPERMDFLNRTAPTFFALLQGILLNDLQLTLSKLADPATTGKRRNLTLETLLEEIKNLPEPQLAAQLTPLLEHYRAASSGTRVRRNKDIAHFEGKHMLYEAFSLHDGANQLLYVLKQGLRYDQLAETGIIDVGDLAQSPYFSV